MQKVVNRINSIRIALVNPPSKNQSSGVVKELLKVFFHSFYDSGNILWSGTFMRWQKAPQSLISLRVIQKNVNSKSYLYFISQKFSFQHQRYLTSSFIKKRWQLIGEMNSFWTREKQNWRTQLTEVEDRCDVVPRMLNLLFWLAKGKNISSLVSDDVFVGKNWGIQNEERLRQMSGGIWSKKTVKNWGLESE